MNDRVHERPLQPPHGLGETHPAFDEYDDDMVKAILGNERLAKPLQDLLTTLHQIEITQGSFGTDHRKVCEAVLPELKALRTACREAWRDM